MSYDDWPAEGEFQMSGMMATKLAAMAYLSGYQDGYESAYERQDSKVKMLRERLDRERSDDE